MISKILSLIYTALCIGLFIYFLPALLIITAALIGIIVIAFFTLKYFLRKETIRVKFNFPGASERSWSKQEDDAEEIREMKDVTNTAKSHKREESN